MSGMRVLPTRPGRLWAFLAGASQSWALQEEPGWGWEAASSGERSSTASGLPRRGLHPPHPERLDPKGQWPPADGGGHAAVVLGHGWPYPAPRRSLAQKRSGTDRWPSPKTRASVSTSVQRGASASAAWAGPGSEHADLEDFGSRPLHPTTFTSLPDQQRGCGTQMLEPRASKPSSRDPRLQSPSPGNAGPGTRSRAWAAAGRV